MLTIRSIFLYLDRTYVISTSGVRSLFEMGLQLFGGHLQQHPEVGSFFRAAPSWLRCPCPYPSVVQGLVRHQLHLCLHARL